jgi:GNAT superfamily N-acetyltransferase
MQIRPLDVDDDAEFASYYRAAEEAERHGRPWAPFWSAAMLRAMFRSDDPTERTEPFAAFEGTEVLGTGAVTFPLLDNLEKVYFLIDTRPAHRRRGVATALLDWVLDRAREEGRDVLVGDSAFPLDADESHPHRRFATGHGFTLGNAEIRRLLELPVPGPVIQAWVDEAAALHRGYRIESYVDEVPEPLLGSYVELLNRLNADAPTGDIDFAAGAMTVPTYLESERQARDSGRQTYRTLAITTGPDGRDRAVAHTALACPPGADDLPNAYQWATLVHADHRGHRLGLAVKAANLRVFQAARPERTRLFTTNSPVNGPMVAINELMGFRPVEISAEFLRHL